MGLRSGETVSWLVEPRVGVASGLAVGDGVAVGELAGKTVAPGVGLLEAFADGTGLGAAVVDVVGGPNGTGVDDGSESAARGSAASSR